MTLNRHRYIPVDQKLKQSRIMKFSKSTKCHIKQSSIEEQTEYFIFTTKLLKFNIRIQVVGAESQGVKEFFNVNRYETDFYILRNILLLSFSQCFVAPLTPTNKEAVFDKKSLMLRERSFSRFLRGIIRNPEILNHPLVIEFLTVDHKKPVDMKAFSKRLLSAEQRLMKGGQSTKRGAGEPGFFLTSYREKIQIEKEFQDQELINEKIERGKRKKFDEARYVMRYEQHMAQLLGLMNKFKTQIDDLNQAQQLMTAKLGELTQLHEGAAQPDMSYIFDCVQRLLDSGNKKSQHELNLQHLLVREHFAYQQQVVTQSIRPFTQLIPQYQNTYRELLKNFLKRRYKLKEEEKQKNGLAQMEQ